MPSKLLAAAALALSAAFAWAQDRVAVGIVTSLSGPMAAPGKFQMNGFRLAEEEINAAGGFSVGGRKYLVELKAYDTRAHPAEAVTPNGAYTSGRTPAETLAA
jgi:branched-chain amino acid transport system substrate-binding protein